jgi:acetyl-CoA acetyltransferase
MVHSAAFVGVGHSTVHRFDDVPLGVLAADACRLAIEDAGLNPSDIDGVLCVPGQPFSISGPMYDGSQYVSVNNVIRTLGLDVAYAENMTGMMIRSVVAAINAIESGLCDTVLVFRALHSPRGTYGLTSNDFAGGVDQLEAPYGVYYPAYFGMLWQRYRHEYGSGSREQMSAFVTQARQHGLLWEHSYWRQTAAGPLTNDDYLSARSVSTPLSIFDCDLPIQSAGAFVLTRADRAKDLRHRPAYVRGLAVASFSTAGSVQPVTLERELDCGRRVARRLWGDARLGPHDIRTANLYDGFSIMALLWLETLGICGDGEAFDFIQGGRIALNGAFPLNTAGGNLGGGRTHGVSLLMESVLQVSRRAGERQVSDADLVLTGIGAQFESGALVLGADPDR